MRICRITVDLAYQDDAEDVPKTERSWRALIDRILDPALGEYMSCATGVVTKEINLHVSEPTPIGFRCYFVFCSKPESFL